MRATPTQHTLGAADAKTAQCGDGFVLLEFEPDHFGTVNWSVLASSQDRSAAPAQSLRLPKLTQGTRRPSRPGLSLDFRRPGADTFPH